MDKFWDLGLDVDFSPFDRLVRFEIVDLQDGWPPVMCYTLRLSMN